MWISSSTAAAQSNLPQGTREGKNTPNERVCYGLSEFKVLLKLDSDLSACAKTAKLLLQKIDVQEDQIDLFKRLTAAQDQIIQLQQAHNKALFEAWKEENKRRHEAENVPSVSSWLGWSVAGVSIAALAGVLTYAAIR